MLIVVVVDDKLQVLLDLLASPVHPDRVDRSESPDFRDSREWPVRKVGKVLPDSRVIQVYPELLDSPDPPDKLDSQDLLDRSDLLVTPDSPVLKVLLEIREVLAHPVAKVCFGFSNVVSEENLYHFISSRGFRCYWF